jgi:hypothetical protein
VIGIGTIAAEVVRIEHGDDEQSDDSDSNHWIALAIPGCGAGLILSRHIIAAGRGWQQSGGFSRDWRQAADRLENVVAWQIRGTCFLGSSRNLACYRSL